MPTVTTRPNMIQWNAIASGRYRSPVGCGWEDSNGSVVMARFTRVLLPLLWLIKGAWRTGVPCGPCAILTKAQLRVSLTFDYFA
jgi:hypothetical protein